jgi:hypothetical protein
MMVPEIRAAAGPVDLGSRRDLLRPEWSMGSIEDYECSAASTPATCHRTTNGSRIRA